MKHNPRHTLRKSIISASVCLLSVICNPIVVPTVGVVAIFAFSYLAILPWTYKISVTILVMGFTMILPLLFIRLYQWLNGWKLKELEHRHKRFIPYLLIICSYTGCIFVMRHLSIPHYVVGIIGSALASMAICLCINNFWKISAHMAGIGQLIGGLIAFSMIFYYNPLGWLCLLILLAGVEGSCSITLRKHTLSQVLIGGAIGVACGISCVLFL